MDQISPSLKLKVQSQIFSTVIRKKNATINAVIQGILNGTNRGPELALGTSIAAAKTGLLQLGSEGSG